MGDFRTSAKSNKLLWENVRLCGILDGRNLGQRG
jgi:hypothetical protein